MYVYIFLSSTPTHPPTHVPQHFPPLPSSLAFLCDKGAQEGCVIGTRGKRKACMCVCIFGGGHRNTTDAKLPFPVRKAKGGNLWLFCLSFGYAFESIYSLLLFLPCGVH